MSLTGKLTNLREKLTLRFYRLILGRKFMPVLNGKLKGMQWPLHGSYLFIYGNYEDPEVLKWIDNQIQSDGVFYDLGANHGYYSFYASKVITTGKIYGFEPMEDHFATIQKIMELNPEVVNREVLHFNKNAVSDTTKEIRFSNIVGSEGNSYIEDSPSFKDSEAFLTVQAVSIDDCVKNGFLPPTFIKIDVEGAEYDVLMGAKETLSKYRPKILLATHDFHLPGVKDKCIRFLKDLGYNVRSTQAVKGTEGIEDFFVE